MEKSYGFTAFNLNGDIISTRRTRKQFESLAKEVGQRYHASEIDMITGMIFCIRSDFRFKFTESVF